MLQLSRFSKSYQNHLVLSVETLSIPPGLHWVKGENGSGKTSFFKSLAGILPFEGDILLDAISLKKEPVAFRKLINFSEAEPLFPEFLTAKDLIRFVGKTKGAPFAQQDYYCRRTGVDLYFTKPCGTYSSGMLKKLSLTLAFLGHPTLIILDEPLVTLDEPSRALFLELVQEKMQNASMTFLLSSHQSIDSGVFPINHIYTVRNKTITQV